MIDAISFACLFYFVVTVGVFFSESEGPEIIYLVFNFLYLRVSTKHDLNLRQFSCCMDTALTQVCK